MIHKKAAKAHSGSVIIWTLVWIAGVGSIAWAAVTYAMPEFEKKQRRTIVRTVANMSELPLSISIKGFNATLSGQVQNAESKASIIDALGFHKGVFTINDNLRIADVEQVIDTPVTPFKFEALVTNFAGNSQDSPARVPLRLVDKLQAIEPSPSNTDAPFGNESGDDESPVDSIEPSAAAANTHVDPADSTLLPEDEQQAETTEPVDDATEIESAADTSPSLIETADLSTVLLAITEPKTQNKPIDPISPSPEVPVTLDSPIEPIEPNAIEEIKAETLTEKEVVKETETADIQLAELATPIEETQPSNPSEPEATKDERLEVLIETVLETALSEVRTSQANDSDGSAAPEPVAPEPVAPEPVASEPVASEPVASEPVASEPVASEPEAPEPVASEPATETSQALRQALSRLPNTQILFELGSAVLTSDSANALNQIADVLASFPESTTSIEGHTDASGESEANLALSLERAVVVRTYLIAQGVSTLKLRAKGYGESKPLASNETATGRATNRRIEFKF